MIWIKNEQIPSAPQIHHDKNHLKNHFFITPITPKDHAIIFFKKYNLLWHSIQPNHDIAYYVANGHWIWIDS